MPTKKEIEAKLKKLENENKKLINSIDGFEKKIKSIDDYCNAIESNISISILVIDSMLRVIDANKNFFRKTGKARDNVINKKIDIVLPIALIRRMNLSSKIKNVIDSESAEEECTVEHMGRVYNYQISPILSDFGSINALLIMDDVTEKRQLGAQVKQIEAHLASVVESASDLVFSANKRGKILTWNRTAGQVLGYDDDDIIERKTFPSLFHKRYRGGIRNKLRELKKMRYVPEFEMAMPTKDGREALISWGLAVMKNDVGKVVGLMGVGRDLTEKMQMEAQLFQTEKLASLGRLSAGVAHEINNPLGIIATSAENLLAREKEDEFKIKNIKRIQAQVDRTTKIVDSLLNFSRPIKPGFKKIIMSDVLEETLALVEHQLKLDNIEVIRSFEPELPAVMGDSSQLQQVFMNIIQNAQQAMLRGGKLYITTQKMDGDDSIQVILKDTGVGITKKNIDHIFDPFYTTREVGKGTGLGLSLSYGIIDKHNGSIWVESKVRKGTTFYITLPVHK